MMEERKERRLVFEPKNKIVQQQPMFHRNTFHNNRLAGAKNYHRPRMDIESTEGVKIKSIDTVSSLVNYLVNRDHQITGDFASYFKFKDDDIKLPSVGLKNFPWEGVTSEILGKYSFEKSTPSVLCWMPAGDRLLCGSSKGEMFRLNANTFKSDEQRTVHDDALKAIKTKRDNKMYITADKEGVIKYFDENLKEIRRINKTESHMNPIREISMCFSDLKFVSCSEDKTLRIWDIEEAKAGNPLQGHGSDVITCEWHPYRGLIASGSKDSSIKLWDPNTGHELTTFYNYNKAVTNVRWNRNGNWLLGSSRDHSIKLWDIRMLKEMQIFKGENQEVGEVEVVAWHPVHERLFVSGDSEGNLAYWLAFEDNMLYLSAEAHEKKKVIDISWSPLGNILTTCGCDKTVKFWGRPDVST